jgi:hypothetical protein
VSYTSHITNAIKARWSLTLSKGNVAAPFFKNANPSKSSNKWPCHPPLHQNPGQVLQITSPLTPLARAPLSHSLESCLRASAQKLRIQTCARAPLKGGGVLYPDRRPHIVRIRVLGNRICRLRNEVGERGRRRGVGVRLVAIKRIGKGGVLGNGLGRCVSWYGLLFDESVTCFGGLLHVYALGFGLILGLYFGLHYAVSRCYNIVTVVLFLFCTFI